MSTQERIDVRSRESGNKPDAARGRPSTPGSGDRLPRPPGTRRPGLAVLAVLLIVLGAAVAGLLALRLDDRADVLVARTTIVAGQQITADNLAVAKVASDGVAVITADQADQVIGRFAGTEIPPGRLIDPGMLVTSSMLDGNKAAVGVPLSIGRFPAGGLEAGDVVQVVRAVEGEGSEIAAKATVSSVKGSEDGVFGSGGDNSTVVTLIVTRNEAVQVAAAAAADQISLVLLERGASTKGN
ncbi:SAF domain-containing protein [Kineosporia sp. J2-2]|uniref:SAF domain-containing protein n=1 Tax=Kineosporia corallincola TaxID=2835133 RepID=A0ABS5TPG2_9ACTN|nr:SAF domain-containing protein [Kineosporia corallincola]MBT0772259.1 SAF domain-containing protein [Kineosporia corallincola]